MLDETPGLSPEQHAEYGRWLEFFMTWGNASTHESRERALRCATERLKHPAEAVADSQPAVELGLQQPALARPRLGFYPPRARVL